MKAIFTTLLKGGASPYRLRSVAASFVAPSVSSKDTGPALLCVPDANKVLIDVWGEQTEQRGVLATQDDHATFFRALCGVRLETRELHSSVRRLLVIAREQHNEVSRVLNGLVHLLDKVRSNRNVVILGANPIPVLLENVGDLLRNGGHRTPTAQEKIVFVTAAARHCGFPLGVGVIVMRESAPRQGQSRHGWSG